MAEPFRTTRRVEFVDTDMAGIVHFANFFRWMESAEVEYLRSKGLSVKLQWEGQMIGLPRVSAACDYMQPARFEDLLEIAVSLIKLGRKSLTYRHEFFKDGQLIARGQISAVCCLVGSQKKIESIEIPASLRARLEPDVIESPAP